MEIKKLKKENYLEFKNGVQEAFQKGFEAYFGPCKAVIIPDKYIYNSYTCKGSACYIAVENNEIIGGCIVQINKRTHINELHILYVKCGYQSKGVGFRIWNEMENLYPETKIWKTCTPYFDQRNIHFYVNKCGFHIVKFLNNHTSSNEIDDEFIGDAGEGMFEFEKIIK